MTVFEFVIVSLAVGYITFALVFSGIFAGLRGWIDGFGLSDFFIVRKAGRHLTNMIGCPFCTGFWVTGALQVFFRFSAIGHGNGILGVLVTWPAITMVAAFLAFAAGHAINRLSEPVEYDRPQTRRREDETFRIGQEETAGRS